VPYLVVGIYLIRPEAIGACCRLRSRRRGQNWLLPVKCNPEPSDFCLKRLKDGAGLVPLPPQRSDEDSALGRKIAELDAAAGEYRDCVFVELVVWFGPQFDRLAGAAYLKLETSARPTFIWVVDADNRERFSAQSVSRPYAEVRSSLREADQMPHLLKKQCVARRQAPIIVNGHPLHMFVKRVAGQVVKLFEPARDCLTVSDWLNKGYWVALGFIQHNGTHSVMCAKMARDLLICAHPVSAHGVNHLAQQRRLKVVQRKLIRR